MRVAEVAGPMMTPFTTSSQTVPTQSLFGTCCCPANISCCCNPSNMGYYSSLLKQRDMMSPQMTEEEYEQAAMGPYYGMGDISESQLQYFQKMMYVAGPVWIIAGFFGDGFGNKLGSAISAVSGAAISGATGLISYNGNNLPGRTRVTFGVIAAIAAGLTILDLYSVLKKRSDSPTFKTKLTKLTKSFAPAH